MDKILQAGQYVAYERGISENIQAITENMTLKNVLDDLEGYKDKLVELGEELTEDEKINFFEEFDEYIEGAS